MSTPHSPLSVVVSPGVVIVVLDVVTVVLAVVIVVLAVVIVVLVVEIVVLVVVIVVLGFVGSVGWVISWHSPSTQIWNNGFVILDSALGGIIDCIRFGQHLCLNAVLLKITILRL